MFAVGRRRPGSPLRARLIDTFVPANSIDERFYDNPYYIVPNDKVGQDAFAVIRDAMKANAAISFDVGLWSNIQHRHAPYHRSQQRRELRAMNTQPFYGLLILHTAVVLTLLGLAFWSAR
jgi:hypothetical protein